MRIPFAAVLLGLLGAAARQEDDRLYVEQVPEEFLRKMDAAREKRDWRKLVELHTLAHDSFARKLAQPDPAVRRWLPLPRVLNLRLSAMPDEARESYESVAEELLSTLEEREPRRRIAEKYSFTRAGRRALEDLANRDFDEGRVSEAIRGWSILLEISPAPELVARLAHAHAAAGDGRALDLLKERGPFEGEIVVGGSSTPLAKFLETLSAAPPAAPALKAGAPVRATPEIPLGSYDLKPDGGLFGRGVSTAVPAFGSLEGKNLLLFTNGVRVTAIDPLRAAGGALADAVEWQFPGEGTVRWMPTANRMEPPHPLMGGSVAGGRAFVTMFTQNWQTRHQQVGRRPDRFEGPGTIRAFDFASGKLLWDIESLEADSGSEKAPLIETLPFGRRNFSFAGPPVARGERVYASIMTSPLTERECWALCLNAADGKPLWCTSVASTTPTRETPAIPSFTLEGGTLVFQTNFGVVAGLDAERGTIEWLVKYTPSARRTAVTAPLVQGSLVTILAQDREEPLALDRWTGREMSFPRFPEVAWPNVHQLLGAVGDQIVVSGSRSYALHPRAGLSAELTGADASSAGRGALQEGRLYLPVRGGVHVYDTGSWKLLGSYRLTEAQEGGNLAVSGGFLVLLGNRLELSTSHAELLERFRTRVEGKTPNAAACRQLGQILESAGRPAEAIPPYRKALSLIENDPAWRESAEGLRKKLQDLAERTAPEPAKP